MTLFFRAFFLIFFIGAEARTLLGNHHGLNKLKTESGSCDDPYDITPITTSSSEKVGRRPHLPPPAPKPSDEEGQTIITSNSTTTQSNYGSEHHTPTPPSPQHNTPIGQLTSSHALQASY